MSESLTGTVHGGVMQPSDTATAVAVQDRANAIAPRVASDNGEVSIAGLLHFAVEKGMPAAELKELVGLHEHMTERAAAREFNRALAAFQQECPRIRKDKTANISTSTGGSYKYTYAELDEIARIINPILTKHGLSYSWDSRVDEKRMLTCVCTVRHENGHSIQSSFTLPTDSKSAMSEQQKVGAALTFAQRRSLTSALGITTTDDDAPAAEVDPTTITEDQVVELEDLITESGADRVKFLRYMQVTRLDDIRAAQYASAKAALSQKMGAKKP